MQAKSMTPALSTYFRKQERELTAHCASGSAVITYIYSFSHRS